MLIDRRRRVGGYILKEQIRALSDGVVYRSGNPFGRLAVTLVAGDPSQEGAFRTRAETVAALRHKSIVPLYDFGSDGGYLYFVTKYIDGETLESSLAAEGRLPPLEAAEIASDILDGLAVAHLKGIVHGGLTPSSVLVSAWSRAVITDLAVPSASAQGDDVEEAPDDSREVPAGAPESAYRPTEQIRGGAPDLRWDIYSVGALLFEMLTAAKPAARGGLAPGEPHPEWPPRRIEAVTPALEATVLRALASDPGDRFSSAAEMSAALGASTQRRSALGEALGAPAAPSAAGARDAPPSQRPEAPPRDAPPPVAGAEAERSVKAQPVAPPATRPAPPRPGPVTSPPARPVTRDHPASRIRRRRRYKHQAQRPSKRRFHLGRWRSVVLAGALGAGAVLALFALFALSISVFLGAGTEGQGASTEPSPVQVERSGTPHLSGKTVEAAAAELRRAGLKLGEVTSAPSGSVAPDHILEQFPAGGTRVPRNTAVDVVVATEPAKG